MAASVVLLGTRIVMAPQTAVAAATFKEPFHLLKLFNDRDVFYGYVEAKTDIQDLKGNHCGSDNGQKLGGIPDVSK